MSDLMHEVALEALVHTLRTVTSLLGIPRQESQET